MITRRHAEQVLAGMGYVRQDIAPSEEDRNRGIYIPVYFAELVTKWYPYGNGKIDGYIAPQFHMNSLKAIARGIGYTGPIVALEP